MVVGVDEQTAEIEHRLRILRALAFHFARTRDDSGEVIALVGVRMHHDVIDIIQLYSECDADAIRIPSTVLNGRPLGMPQWSASGAPAEVIDMVLSLPDPESYRGIHPHASAEPGRLG